MNRSSPVRILTPTSMALVINSVRRGRVDGIEDPALILDHAEVDGGAGTEMHADRCRIEDSVGARDRTDGILADISAQARMRTVERAHDSPGPGGIYVVDPNSVSR